MPEGAIRSELPRVVGFWGASAVMVGIMIGSGIFRTPASIALHLSSPGLILLLWLAGGVLSLLGAFIWAELCSMYPRSGGVYVFLREAYGAPMAFTFGWTYMLITKPAAASGIATVFAENVLQLAGVQASPEEKRWMIPAITSGALVVLTVINVWGVRQSAAVSIALTAFKVLALLGVAVLGGLFLQGFIQGTTSPAPDPAEVPAPASKAVWLAIVPVMSKILWTYDGWSDVGAIAGEVKSPGKLLPRVFIVNTIAITLLYLAVNAVYLKMVPLNDMRGMESLAPHVIGRLLGPQGAVLVVVIIIISTLGSSHGSIMTGARVSFAQANDGLLFGFLSKVHPRFRTPAVSLWMQLALSLAAVWALGAFDRLADSFVFSMWIFYGLGAASLLILRVRRPGAARPFRCPAPWAVTGLFVLAAAGMTVMSIVDSWKNTLPWIGVLLLGWPMYYLWRRLTRTPPAVEGGAAGE